MPHSLISIIIPTLNEEAALPQLLADLSCQEDVDFEVIVSDGGSVDETVPQAKALFASKELNGQVLQGEKGRGRQLNLGVEHVSGEWLLFLHADSRLPDRRQIGRAVRVLEAAQTEARGTLLAGRFALSFDLPESQRSFAYYYYETKARLGRPGCIHGDQGFLLRRADFKQVGPFREDLPVMEDTWLAERVRRVGRWLILPGEIKTSARRFQVEGLFERQLLNALLMNFLFIDWPDFLHKAPGLYSAQGTAGRLQLYPFFAAIDELLRPLSLKRRWQLWLATGRYVRGETWQLGLRQDCRRRFALSQQLGEDRMRWLSWFDRWFEPLTDHWLGHLLTAALVRLWFSLTLRRLRTQHLKEVRCEHP